MICHGVPILHRHPQTLTDTTDRLKTARYESKLIEYDRIGRFGTTDRPQTPKNDHRQGGNDRRKCKLTEF
jgi:hypothetical protein